MKIDGPVLVTGGTGFIGRKLIDRLVALDKEIVSFALPGEPIPDHWGDKVKVLSGDITKADDVNAAMSGIQTVIHLAAVVGMGAYDIHWSVTVEGSRNIYDAAVANDTKVVLASSIVVYGDQIQSTVCHEGLEHGNHQGAYSRAKMAQEKLALTYQADRGMKLVVVRPANVYGVGSGPWVEGMLGLIRNDMLQIVAEGTGNAGLVHVSNLVEAFLLAATDPKAVGQIYTACDGLDISWSRYFNDLAAMVGKPPLTNAPLNPLIQAAREHENPAKLEAMEGMPTIPLELLNLIGYDNRFDTKKLREELGWQPHFTYAEAMAEIHESLGSKT
jgi:nucleoside-diphosphate-sugar epimerase